MPYWFEEEGLDSDSGSGSEDERDPTPARAGRELVDLLIFLKMTSQISAMLCYTTCYWCQRAGATGDVSNFARPRGSSPRDIINGTWIKY